MQNMTRRLRPSSALDSECKGCKSEEALHAVLSCDTQEEPPYHCEKRHLSSATRV